MPSEKVLSVFILCVGFVVGTIFAVKEGATRTVVSGTKGILETRDLVSIPTNDNWQDAITPYTANFASSSLETEGPQTKTDSFSTSLLANYLALKESGKLDSSSAQKLVSQSENFLFQTDSSTFTTKDIKIIPDSKDNMYQYGDDLGNAISSNRQGAYKNELEIFKAAVENEDPEKIKELASVALIYQHIFEDTKEIAVPKAFIKVHLDMLNGIKLVELGLKDMQGLFDDPVLGLSGMKKYQDGATVYSAAKKATVQYLLLNSVQYKQGSGGYYLIYGI